MPKGWVYILAGGTGTLYTGVTSKLSQRVLEHKRGIKSGFASKYHCDRLAYFEEYGDIRSAIAREKTIKGWTRAKKIALIESLNPEWKDLAQHWGSPTLVPGQSMQEENDRQRRRIQLPMDSSASQAQRQNDNQPPWRQEKCRNSRASFACRGPRFRSGRDDK